MFDRLHKGRTVGIEAFVSFDDDLHVGEVVIAKPSKHPGEGVARLAHVELKGAALVDFWS